MNCQRILGVAHGYFLLTGYQIRSLNNKTKHYTLKLWGALHFVILFVWYLICFEHHLETSSFLKIFYDLSPFLKNLVILQIWLGLKVFVFAIVEWRSLTAVINGLADIVLNKIDSEDGKRKFNINEMLAYVILFITLVVASGIGLYIAIEMKFELPPLDHIMIAMALCLPHLMISGSLRMYNLSLWLIRQEICHLKEQLKKIDLSNQDVIIEIINPTIEYTQTPEVTKTSQTIEEIREVFKKVQNISIYIKNTSTVLNRQLFILNGLNFNCLLYGIFTRLYFEKTWGIVFYGNKRRIFYAANASIFICIYLDYIVLLLVQFTFNRMKHQFSHEVETKIEKLANETHEEKFFLLCKIQKILKDKFKFKLFNLMDFNMGNFLMIQILMLTIIGVIVLYQYFTDQIATLTEQLDSYNSD